MPTKPASTEATDFPEIEEPDTEAAEALVTLDGEGVEAEGVDGVPASTPPCVMGKAEL